MSDKKGPEKYRFGWTDCPIDAACRNTQLSKDMSRRFGLRNSSSDSDSSDSAPQPSSAPLAASVAAINDDAAPLIPVMPAAAAAAAVTLGQQTQEAPAPVLFPPEPVHYSVFRGLNDEMTRLFGIAEDSRKVADEIKKKIHEADEWLEGNIKYVQNPHETEDEYYDRMLDMWGDYGTKSKDGPRLTFEKIKEAEEVANKIDEVTGTLRTFFLQVPKEFPDDYRELTPCQFLNSLKGTGHGYNFMKVYPFEQLVQCNLNKNDLEFLKDVVYKESDDVFKESNQDSYMILLKKLIQLQEEDVLYDMVLTNGMTLTDARGALNARYAQGGKRNKTLKSKRSKTKSKRSKTKSKRSQHRKNKSKREKSACMQNKKNKQRLKTI
jgi:hypothetical protein